jgi:large subunit ribosomal protein L46
MRAIKAQNALFLRWVSSLITSQISTPLTKNLGSQKHICLWCRRSIASSQRGYASAATATSLSDQSQSISQLTHLETPPSQTPKPAYTIKAGVVLSRPPILTPDPHPFETAYYLYQRRLNERLVLPFSQYFYYQRDTPAYERWRAARRARNGVAGRDVGGYNAYDKEAWNDEVLVGDKAGEKETIVKQLIEEEGRGKEFAGEDGQVEMAGLTRMTEADRKGDVRSLERALSRTLYLLVKRKRMEGKDGGFWSFPSGELEGKEGLKEVS